MLEVRNFELCRREEIGGKKERFYIYYWRICCRGSMTYSITVYKTFDQKETLFNRNFENYEKFQNVLAKTDDNKKRIEWPEMLIAPVRTDNCSNFCQDFFLPGFFDTALKIDRLALKIVIGIGLVLWDILTLPIRVFTAYCRYRHNADHPKEAHPFYQYLITHGVLAEELSAGHVYLKIKNGLNTRWDTFNFMELPKSVSPIANGQRIGGEEPVLPNFPDIEAIEV